MREKYVDEQYPPLMLFGKAADGRVGVCDAVDRVDLLLAPADAEKLVAAYNRVQNQLVRCAMAFDAAAPEAFSAFWYGGAQSTPQPADARADQPLSES